MDSCTTDHQGQCNSMEHDDHGTVAGTVYNPERLKSFYEGLESFLELYEDQEEL